MFLDNKSWEMSAEMFFKKCSKKFIIKKVYHHHKSSTIADLNLDLHKEMKSDEDRKGKVKIKGISLIFNNCKKI